MSDPLLDGLGIQMPAGGAQQAGQQDPLLAGLGIQAQPAQPSQSQTSGLAALIAGKKQPAAPLTRMDKIGRGMMDPINGGAQLLTKMLPDSVVSAGNSLNNWLADKTGLVARLPEGGVDQMTRDQEAQYQAQRAAQGESGFDGYRTVGNVVSPANLAIASRVPLAASLAGRVGLGATVGAGTAALTPVSGPGDFTDEKLKQMRVGAIAGGLLPLATGALSRVVSPNASKNTGLQLLKDEGVQPTIGQTLGGWANAAEQKMTSVPVIGDMISRARGNANTTFQDAAYNRALAPIGETLPDGLTGRAAVLHTETTLNNAYDNVLGKIGAITVDQPFAAKVAKLQGMVKGLVMPAAEKDKFASALNDVSQSLDQNGAMTSDAYKALESSLGSDARKLAGSQNIYENKVAPAVKQLQGELRDMLTRQAGPQADDLAAVNAGWANFKRVQAAAGKVGAEDGQFSPAQFLSAVRALDKSKDKGAFARGSALGQDLGDAGKSVLGAKVPDSGTPGRIWMGATALGAGATVSPMVPAAMLGGAALYSTPAQRALVAAASARPQLADPVAEFLRRASPYLGAGAVDGGLGLLK